MYNGKSKEVSKLKEKQAEINKKFGLDPEGSEKYKIVEFKISQMKAQFRCNKHLCTFDMDIYQQRNSLYGGCLQCKIDILPIIELLKGENLLPVNINEHKETHKISDYGRFFGCDNKQLSSDNNRIQIRKGEEYHYSTSNVVFITFVKDYDKTKFYIGEINGEKSEHIVCHADLNIENNRLDNLFLATRSESKFYRNKNCYEFEGVLSNIIKRNPHLNADKFLEIARKIPEEKKSLNDQFSTFIVACDVQENICLVFYTLYNLAYYFEIFSKNNDMLEYYSWKTISREIDVIITDTTGYENIGMLGEYNLSLYRANSIGNVINSECELLKPQPSNDGYFILHLVCILPDGKTTSKNFRIHRLVGKCFPNIDKLISESDTDETIKAKKEAIKLGKTDNLVINHKDEVKTNNDSNNLEWVTQQQNMAYSCAIKVARINTFDRSFKPYDSLIAAAAELEIPDASKNLSQACKAETALIKYGFWWRYLQVNGKPEPFIVEPKLIPKIIKVNKKPPHNDIDEPYKNLTAAAKSVKNGRADKIEESCLTRNVAHGFLWRHYYFGQNDVEEKAKWLSLKK